MPTLRRCRRGRRGTRQRLATPAALDGAVRRCFGHPQRRRAARADRGGQRDWRHRHQRPRPRGDGRRRSARCAKARSASPAISDSTSACRPSSQALRDPEEDVRRAAIEQLPVLDDVDAVGQLRSALAGETPRNRAAAAHAMRQVDDPRAGGAAARRAERSGRVGPVLRGRVARLKPRFGSARRRRARATRPRAIPPRMCGSPPSPRWARCMPSLAATRRRRV